MRNLLVSDRRLGACICAHLFHSRCQQHWPRFRETTSISTYPISTSDILRSCVYIQCTFHLSSNCCSWHNSFLLLSRVVQVMRVMDGNVIHSLKHGLSLLPRSLLYIMWWTSSRDKLTWLWFCSIDAACSMIALFVMWNKPRFHFSKKFEMWASSCQMPKCRMNTGSRRYGTMKTTMVTWRVWKWRRLSTADN